MADPHGEMNDELNRFRPRAMSEALRRRIRQDVAAGGALQLGPERRWRRRRWLTVAAATAACVVLAIGVWAFRAAGPKEEPGPGPRGGARLAAGCRLEPVGPAQYELIAPRRVRLDRGEVYVAVAPSPGGEPFVIETAAADVQAVGAHCYVDAGRTEDGSTIIPTNELEGDRAMTQSTIKPRWLTTVLIAAGVVQMVSPQGSVTGVQGELLAAEQNTPPKKHVEHLTAKFGQFYEPVVVEVKPSIPPYRLPLLPEKVANWQHVIDKLKLTETAQAKLRANGFVVVPWPSGDDVVEPYKTIKLREVPVFATVDTLLHLYHERVEESLEDIEQREFYPDLLALARMMVGDLGETEAKLAAGAATDAAQLNLAALHKAHVYAAIGLKCLDPNWAAPATIAEEVTVVVDKMEKHEGFWPHPSLASQQWPLFRYAEDFSQYLPRGHYTHSKELQRYFKGIMWFGRMSLLLKGEEPYGPADEPALVSPQEAQLQTMAAAHLTKLLADGKLADGRNVREVWERIYTVTAFYAGLADDLGFQEYETSLKKVLGASIDVAALAKADKFRQLQAELAKYSAPTIYGGTGSQVTYRGTDPGKLVQMLDKSTGFRLMGQRYAPDAYIMGKLVSPTVGRPNNRRTDMFTFSLAADGPIRGFPRGLDVMAVLGSPRARHWLHELGDDAYGRETDSSSNPQGSSLTEKKNLPYHAVLDDLQREFAGLTPRDFNRNVYWSWLYALRPLLKVYGKGYPTFMTTGAWQDKSMNTALASWAQLRHDMILCGKQPFSGELGGSSRMDDAPVEGYVEPMPEFYAHLLATTRMTLGGLKALNVVQPDAIDRLQKLEELIATLLRISQAELAHKDLSEADYKFIRNLGETLEDVRNFGKTLPEIYAEQAALREAMSKADREADLERFEQISRQLMREPPMQNSVIADVHTDQNSGRCLEEGTGNVDLLVACYLQPDGRLVLGAGPVLSYYEFKHPVSDRLTDEQWRWMLETAPPPRPEWTSGYRVAK
jgi:cytochrome c556